MAKKYDFAIRLGLRSLIQLQFDGDDDAFYVAREIRRYVDGGIRASVYDNRIHGDNVQHRLMAALKFLSVSKSIDGTPPAPHPAAFFFPNRRATA